MRLIIEFDEILIDYLFNQKLNLTIQKINSAFLKDLRISQSSCCLLIDNYSFINYDFVNNSEENSSNSLYFLTITEENNNTRKININSEPKSGSIISNSGFVQIFHCEKSISININLFSNNKIHNNLVINTNNEIIINNINFKFCKDSLKDIIYFCKKLSNDIQTILNLKSAFKDDVEKIIVEKDALSINNLKEQLKNKEIDTQSIEFRSVKYNEWEYHNSNMYNRLLNSTKDINNENSNRKNRKEDNIVIDNNIFFENKNKNKKKNYKMNLYFNNIKIYLYDGEDFNFQGNHTLIVFYNSTLTAENRSQGNVIKTNERNINNNILISLNDLQCKYSQKTDEIEINSSLKSLIIEDNLKNSIYKKLLSHFDFQNDKNIFLNSKIKISKDKKNGGDGATDANVVLAITPISIYLDKITLDFMINYFNVLKYIINHENEEDNEEDIYSNDSNKKLNNRIIQNNDDIMNINNEDNNSNSNDDLMGDQEISSINRFQNDNLLKTFLNPDKLYFKNLIINPFFISFNYNPRKENTSEEEETETYNNDDKLKHNKFLNYLKNISLNEFVLNFKKYENNGNENQIKLKNVFKELFDYYYNDIIDYKSFNNYVKALPVLNKFCSVFDSFYNIWNKTINHEQNNNTMKEGFIQGTQDLVVNTTCSILSIGESITNYFTKILNIKENNNKNEGIIKAMKKKINKNLSKKEEYYFK